MASQLLIGALAFFVCFANGFPVTHTLQLLHVLFRHGDRTETGPYPNDPYKNYTFWPVGLGQLTNAGKRREYNIGRYLRETYGDFIGDVYFPDLVKANSSTMDRTKASLQLVNAGLFPPADIQKWSDTLDWQPIPFDVIDSSENYMFFSTSICKQYNSYVKTYRASETYEDVYEPYTDVLEYLEEESGMSSTTNIASSLYSTLLSQKEWGLELPDWTDVIWPEPLFTVTKLDWQQMFATNETRAIGAGFLMSKIVNDSQAEIAGDESVEDTKIYLYSGHDTNIAAVLSWIGVPDLHTPQYGSFIIFEIHEEDDVPFIRMVHQNYELGNPQHVEIPGCGFDCPLDTFIELYSYYINPYQLCN